MLQKGAFFRKFRFLLTGDKSNDNVSEPDTDTENYK